MHLIQQIFRYICSIWPQLGPIRDSVDFDILRSIHFSTLPIFYFISPVNLKRVTWSLFGNPVSDRSSIQSVFTWVAYTTYILYCCKLVGPLSVSELYFWGFD